MTRIAQSKVDNAEFRIRRSRYDEIAEQWSHKVAGDPPAGELGFCGPHRDVSAIQGFRRPRYLDDELRVGWRKSNLVLTGARSAFDLSGRHALRPLHVNSRSVTEVLRDGFVATTSNLRKIALLTARDRVRL